MGMTRSDNPFGDLPEWKERRRLQEAQAQRDTHQNRDPNAHQQFSPGHAPDPHQAGPGYSVPGQREAYHPDLGYSEPNHSATSDRHAGQPQYGTEFSGDPRSYGGQVDPAYAAAQHSGVPPTHDRPGGVGQVAYTEPYYDPQSQITYPRGAAHPGVGGYATDGGGSGYDAAGQNYAPIRDDFGLRGGQHDQPYGEPGGGYGHGNGSAEAQYGAPTLGGASAGSAAGQAPGEAYYAEHGAPPPSYDFDNYAPGQAYPGDSHGNEYAGAGYADGLQSERTGSPHWADGPGGAAAGALGGAAAQSVLDEDEYYDDDEDDEPKWYSWKLMAAIVVTGAVVTGGGVVLYDSFKGGGLAPGGSAPIIKADQGPNKTAPVDAGGRQFAHQDSKLLGRLDSNKSSSGSEVAADTSDTGNRVRAVPTVKIGRDGRLILPQAPKAVASAANVEASTEGTSIPGINVVDTLNGQNRSRFGALPPALPPGTTAPSTRTVAVPEVAPPKAPVSTPAAPIIRNRGAANLATARDASPPPVPSRSAVGSAWRMTGAQNSNAGGTSSSTSATAAIRPSIAQPVSPTRTASTLGAASVASTSPTRAGTRRYVAVLATAPTQVQALQSFAELQQRHPAALQNKVPSVQRADLKARGLGVMYRLVVGPAASRGVANSVCNSLKSEGYKGCWVKSN